MKKKITVLTLIGAIILSFAACGQTAQPAASTDAAVTEQNTEAVEPSSQTESIVLKVGASPTPHAQILEVVKPILAQQGIDLQITEYTDYVIPNTAVESHELDANYFQHLPYLENFNEENGTHLISAAAIHFEPLGIYPGKTASLADLKDGAVVAVPNDTTNEARALFLLQQEGLITLPEGADLTITPKDIVDNPKNLTFVEVEAAAVPRTVADVDIAVINGNYALDAGFTGADALAAESSTGIGATTYANIVAVYEGDENRPEIKALIQALQSDEVRTFIEETYNGAVVPMF